MDKSFLFSGFNHIESRSGLDAAANVDGFHFDQNAGVIRMRKILQLDERRVADGFQDGFANAHKWIVLMISG